ncbi:MAG: hypothetical protein C0502_03480 [Opitutus sp.]|nr:hypothetical protein [Opitutus sp.]
MPATPRTLRAVIFYDDLAAVERAIHTLRADLRRTGGTRTLDPLLWPIDLLDEALWLRLAAADVASAETCVVSWSRRTGRTGGARLWLRELAPRLARHWRMLPPPLDAALSQAV